MATETTNSNAAKANTTNPAGSGKRTSTTTKKAQLIRMLNRKAGADVATISAKLGWQQHTTRAALTGLRKSGYEIVSEKAGQGQPSRYRIVAEPAAASN